MADPKIGAIRPLPRGPDELAANAPQEVRKVVQAFHENVFRFSMLYVLLEDVSARTSQYEIARFNVYFRRYGAMRPTWPAEMEGNERVAFAKQVEREIDEEFQHPSPRDGGPLSLSIAKILESLSATASIDGFRTTIGFQVLFGSMVIGAWTTFEALASDLWVTVVNLYPKRLGKAAINAQAKRDDDPDADSGGKQKNPKLKFIESLIGDDDLEASRQIGELIKRAKKFDFNLFSGIQDAYCCAFGTKSESLFSGDALAVTEGLRNVLVHHGGLADEMYRRRFKKHRSAYESFGLTFPAIDEPVRLNGEIVARVGHGTVKAGVALVEYVTKWIGDNPKAE